MSILSYSETSIAVEGLEVVGATVEGLEVVGAAVEGLEDVGAAVGAVVRTGMYWQPHL